MNQQVLTLPFDIINHLNHGSNTPNNIKKIVATMIKWCDNSNKDDIKGLIVHRYDCSEHLEFYRFTKDSLKKKLDIETFGDPSSRVLVYNPSQKVILNICTVHTVTEEDTERCYADIKLLLFLYYEQLKNSGIRIMGLLVADELNDTMHEEQIARSYKIPIALMENFKSKESFMDWWDKTISNMDFSMRDNYAENKTLQKFCYNFFAKLLGFMGSWQFFSKSEMSSILPSLTEEPVKQIEETIIFLSGPQIEAIYCEYNHLIVEGSYGSGKSIIARLKLKLLAKASSTNEKNYFVCFDGKTDLVCELERDIESWGRDIREKIDIHVNREGKKLSQIVHSIIENEKHATKINLIVDEFDGESLDVHEATELNKVFNENSKFKEAVVVILVQPIKKERIFHNYKQSTSMFDNLEKMCKVKLPLVFRNSVEINNLVTITQEVLQSQKTVFIQPFVDENIATASTVTNKHGNVTLTLTKTEEPLPLKMAADKDNSTNIEKPPRLMMITDKNNYTNTEIPPKLNVVTEKDNSKTDMQNTISATHSQAQSTKQKQKNYPTSNNVDIDEAFKYATTANGMSNENGMKIINSFGFINSKMGHQVKSPNLPNLFEISDCEEIAYDHLIISMCAILTELKIKNFKSNDKSVILHFEQNDQPKLFTAIFEMLDVNPFVTSEINKFYEKDKYIFISRYRKVRGLEFGNVIVLLNPEEYFEMPYLPEMLSRCMTNLHIILIERKQKSSKKNTEACRQLIIEWRKRKAVKQWIVRDCHNCNCEHQDTFYNVVEGDQKCIQKHVNSEKYKRLRNHFIQLSFRLDENKCENERLKDTALEL